MGVFMQTNVVYLVFVLLLDATLLSQTKSENLCDLDLESTLRTLLTQDRPSIQVRALRRELLKKLLEELEEEEQEKSIKKDWISNNLPYKRNLESLARAGYIKTLPEEEDNDDNNFKRSIAYLAKNGQLPPRFEDKRGLESLARNGDLHHPQKNIQNLLEDLYGKRNIGSLARNFDFPSYGKRFIGSLAKSGDLGFHRFQRNVASLAREGIIKGKRDVQDPDQLTDPQKQNTNEDKRNLPSIKAQFKQNPEANRRNKREADYYFPNDEYPVSAYQGQNVYDYDDSAQELVGDIYPEQDKRFLGSVARTGWFQPSSGSSKYSRFVSPGKRHIGSLARLGWLPSFRHIRRFNRSGRSASSDDTCRETSSNGETEVNSNSENSSLPVDDDRFSYISRPPVDRSFTRAIFFHPRSH